MLVGVFVVALLLIAALIGVNVLVYQLGRIQFALVAAAFAAIAAIGRALPAMVRAAPEPIDQIEVPRESEPDLYALVDRIAADVGTRAPDRIVVVSEVNAYVYETAPFLGLVSGRRTLAIGTPLFDVLDVSQFTAVLAHELGHFSGGDTRLGPLAFRTEMALVRVIESTSNPIVGAAFEFYWRLQKRVNAKVRRGQELAADRAAVRIAGRQPAADALQSIAIAAHAQELLKNAYLLPLLEAGCRPTDLASGFRSIVATPARVEQLRGLTSEAETAHPWDSHPATSVRIERVAAIAETAEVPRDERAAQILLNDAEVWTTRAIERWMELVTEGSELRLVEWSEWGDIVVADEQRDRAGDVDVALHELGLSEGLDGLEAALAGGQERELAAALVRTGWRSGGASERDALLRGALTAVTSREAVDGGATWALSWSGPVGLLDRKGGDVDLTASVAAALEGDWSGLRTITGARKRSRAKKAEAAAKAVAPPTPVSGTLPAPPSPPFLRDGDGWMAEIDKPMRASSWRVRVDEMGVVLDGRVVPFDDVGAAAIGVRRKDNALLATITLATTNGGAVSISPKAAIGKGAAELQEVVAYLWDAMTAMCGKRLGADAVQQVRSGGSVRVGDFVLSQAGVAHKNKTASVIAWKDVSDLIAQDGDVFLFGADKKKPIKSSLTGSNVWLLPQIHPELRALYG
ncbi:MAG: M48 family metallopeptidase [Acidimicrobiales bacterium]|nr:M48 family metallopeptidase [Acidimicrobiales bacterium]